MLEHLSRLSFERSPRNTDSIEADGVSYSGSLSGGDITVSQLIRVVLEEFIRARPTLYEKILFI